MNFTRPLFFAITLVLHTWLIRGQTANSLYESGLSKYQQNDMAGAISEFSRCIEKNEIFYDAYIGRGDCYTAQKKFTEALKDFSKALEIYPNYYPAYLKRAGTYALAGENKKAHADFARAIEINKNKEDAYLERAKLYQKNNELKPALADLSNALEINGKNAAVFYQRALIYELQKKDKEALSDYSKCITLNPLLAEAYYRRGLLYEKSGDYKAAAADFTKATTMKIHHKELFLHKAQTEFFSGLWNDAIGDYGILINEYTVKEAATYYNRAICYYNTGKATEALKDFSKSAQLNTKYDSAYLYIARIYESQNNLKSALTYYNKTIAVNPGNYYAFAGRAKNFMGQQKFVQAIQDWNTALKSKPVAEWYFERALCKEAIKDKKGMCDDLKSAADLGNKKAVQMYDACCK